MYKMLNCNLKKKSKCHEMKNKIACKNDDFSQDIIINI